jgi:hypothetical protein
LIVIDEQVVIERAPEDVFRYLADGFFDHVRAFNPDAVEAVQTSEGPVQKGTRGREAQMIQGKRRERELVVEEYEVPSVFTLRNATETPLEKHYLSRWRFIPVENGTRVEQRFELAWTMLAFRLFKPFIRRLIAKDIRAAQGRLKAAIETSVPPRAADA